MTAVFITQSVITQKLQAALFAAKLWGLGYAVCYMWKFARLRVVVPALMKEIT